MENILEQLYYGKIFPAEQYSQKEREGEKIFKKHYKEYEDFIKKLEQLNPPLDKQFIEIMDAQLDLLPIEYNQIFIDGFRLGAKIMAEVFRKD